MRVGYGTTNLARGLAGNGVDGIGIYTRELGRALLDVGDVGLVPVGFGHNIDTDVFPQAQRPVSMGRYPGLAGLGVSTPFAFRGESALADQIDLFHATDNLIPKLSRIPVVATLADAFPLSHPEWIRMKNAHLKCWLWKRAAHWADHIVTVSEYSKGQIVEYFGIAAHRITVIPEGVGERFFQLIAPADRKTVLSRYGLPEQFFLSIGTLQPRKNIGNLLDAHAALPAALRTEFPLVVVGREGWGSETLVSRLQALQAAGTVYWLQYLPDEDMRALMQSASALVFPSLGEGFGLPVLEAFASRLPVVTSDTTSLPEVAGQAAVLVDPSDPLSIADGMRRVVEDSALANRLITAGLARARLFTWQACAIRTQAVYRSVLT